MILASLLIFLSSPPLSPAADTWQPLTSTEASAVAPSHFNPKLRTNYWEIRKQNQNQKQTKESGFHSTDFLHGFGSYIFNLITQPLNAISEHNITYDAENKTLLLGEIEFSIVFAIEEFILILTEMVAYVLTDQLMRAVWPV